MATVYFAVICTVQNHEYRTWQKSLQVLLEENLQASFSDRERERLLGGEQESPGKQFPLILVSTPPWRLAMPVWARGAVLRSMKIWGEKLFLQVFGHFVTHVDFSHEN